MLKDEIREILNELYDKAIFHLNNQWQKKEISYALIRIMTLIEKDKSSLPKNEKEKLRLLLKMDFMKKILEEEGWVKV